MPALRFQHGGLGRHTHLLVPLWLDLARVDPFHPQVPDQLGAGAGILDQHLVRVEGILVRDRVLTQRRIRSGRSRTLLGWSIRREYAGELSGAGWNH